MKKPDAAFVIAAAFSTLFTIAYVSILYFKITVPRYFPLDHRWALNSLPGRISQAWYGMFGLAFLSAFIICLIGYVILRSDSLKSTPAIFKCIGTVTFVVIAFMLVWFGCHEFMK
jgi:hypothetical protein